MIIDSKLVRHSQTEASNECFEFWYHTLTREEDATERAIFAALASLSAPVTVTYISKSQLAEIFNVFQMN